jgi:hypothetical protein
MPGPRRHLPLLALLGLAACQDEGTVCAAVFGIHTVYVQDQAGAPVTDATVTPVLVRTGDTLQNRTLALLAPGYYFLIDDSYTELLRPDRDSLAVGLTRGPATLEAGYIFRRDACGVVRVAGPDTLTVP